MTTLLTALLLSAAAALVAGDGPVLLSYRGHLTPVAVAGPVPAAKGFRLQWLMPADAAAPAFLVTAEDAAALPWHERFGLAAMEVAGDAEGPRIGYHFAGRDHALPVPGGLFAPIAQLAAGETVSIGSRRFLPTGAATVFGRDCVTAEVETAIGREGTIAVEAATGRVVRADRSVVLGRGDRFRMVVELESATSPDGVNESVLFGILRELAAAVQTEEATAAGELSAEAVAAAGAVTARLSEAAAGTPYAAFAAEASRDLDARRLRAARLGETRGKIVGSPAPPLALHWLDGGGFDEKPLDGRLIVLHFWEYDAGSDAPFGQTGYLDFLHRRRSDAGVAVVGVAVHEAGEPNRIAAARSAKKFAAFLKLGYPVTTDDGTLLTALGDPRSVGGRLPLWVVIDRDRVVRVYHAGLYPVQPAAGLAELDAVIADLLRRSDTATQ